MIFRRKSQKYFTKNWQDLTIYCKARKTWPVAITEADRLLNIALKQKKYKGKTLGERLVSAQHDLRLNEEIWFLRLKIMLIPPLEYKLNQAAAYL